MGIWSSIVGAVGSLFGAGANYKSQQSANKTNLQIAQMNNEYNERMLQKQLDYNTEMWNKQNEYNTASNQRARLEAAGLNPYMMMSGGDAGTAQSANGINTPTATPVSVQAPQFDMSGFSGFLQQAIDLQATKAQRDADANLKDSQAEGIRIENQYKVAQIVADIAQRQADTKNKEEQTVYQKILNEFSPSQFSSDVLVKQRTAANLAASAKLATAQAAYTSVLTAKARKELSWIDSMAAANIAEIMSRVDLNEKQGRLAVANALESEARKHGIDLDNHIKDEATEDIIRDYKNRADLSGWQSEGAKNNSGPQSWPQYLYGLSTGRQSNPLNYIFGGEVSGKPTKLRYP